MAAGLLRARWRLKDSAIGLVVLLTGANVLVATAPARAAPGDLDPTFGQAGRVFVDIENDDDLPAGIVSQPDGKIIVGRSNTAATDDFSVLRLHSDGSLDTSFDADGRTSLDIPGSKGTTTTVLRQPDGRIVAAGLIRQTAAPAITRLGLVRYLESGSPDTTFGDGGVVIQSVDFHYESISSVVLQPDGRLVVAGNVRRAATSRREIALTRFGSDGSLDGSFGQDGYAFGNGNSWEYMGQLILQPDGKLLVFADVESATPKTWYDWSPAIMRFNADGSLDTAFGENGRALVLSAAAFASVAMQSDGRMLLAASNNPYHWDLAYCGAVLARLGPDGRLDQSFGIDGLKQVPLGGCTTFGNGILIEPTGNIFLNGNKATNDVADRIIDTLDHVVTRLTSSGELDRSFALAGWSVLDVGDGGYLPYASGSGGLLRQDDGKLVIVTSGIRDLISRGNNNRLVIARLQASGGSPGLIGIKAVDPRASTSDGRITVPIRRSGGSQGIVSVDYSTASGSASGNSGFIPATGTLTWADGDRADKTIVIEGAGTFTLSLANTTGGASLATSEIEVTINAPTPAVTAPPPTLPAANSKAGGGGGAMSWELLVLIALWASGLAWAVTHRSPPRSNRSTVRSTR